jgi:hypothetical protein
VILPRQPAVRAISRGEGARGYGAGARLAGDEEHDADGAGRGDPGADEGPRAGLAVEVGLATLQALTVEVEQNHCLVRARAHGVAEAVGEGRDDEEAEVEAAEVVAGEGDDVEDEAEAEFLLHPPPVCKVAARQLKDVARHLPPRHSAWPRGRRVRVGAEGPREGRGRTFSTETRRPMSVRESPQLTRTIQRYGSKNLRFCAPTAP